tara:strand:+ start:132 stop:539 length:408 start_codon:yes stop_codon:yes gene_type:complete
MAIITANVTLNTDITGYSASANMTMRKLGSTAGIDNATGISTKKFASTDAVAVIEEDEVTNSKASKVYMRNTGSSKETYFHVAINASAAADTTTETIGRLYGGDWMLVPYEGATNLNVAPSTANDMTLEYGLFYE